MLQADAPGGVIRKVDRDLADKLLRERHLTQSELGIALAELKRHGGALHTHITRLGLMPEAILRDVRAAMLHLPVVDMSLQRPDASVERLISGALAKQHQILPVARADSGQVLLATADPFDLIAIDQVSAALRSKAVAQVSLGLAGPTELHREIDRIFGERVTVESIIAAGGREPPIDKVVEAVLQQAYDLEASDVHFEPDEFFLRIRLRIDGVLRQTQLLHISIWAALVVRLKVMAGMNIAENRAAQDGRFSLRLGMRDIDFRAACLPTAHGENIVLRLLDRGKNIVSFKRIDMSETARQCIRSLMARPEGIILITGPTGSGKTTTLYSMLTEVSTEEVNVMTLEDPIEYPLPLIRQTQVTEKLGFAEGIRALMRQDPDVILVGEVRDRETAQMAFRAAMTGHQVYATLHTNSALGAVQRLRDIGISSSVLAGNLIGVIGQRLARRLCSHCKQAVPVSAQERALLGIQAQASGPPASEGAQSVAGARLFKPRGCANCHHSGFRGRVPLFEVLAFNETLDEMVANDASQPELGRQARLQGYTSLREDAIRRVLLGETSIGEVSRVVNLAQP